MLWTLFLCGAAAFIAWLLFGQRDDQGRPPPSASSEPDAADRADRRARYATRRMYAGAMPAFALELPALDGQAHADVPSESEPGTVRRVELGARTCTCPDFAKHRAALDASDIRRLCKHAVAVIRERGLDRDAPALVRALLEDKFLTGYDAVYADTIDGHPVAIAFRNGERWINLFGPATAPKKSSGNPRYQRFGFDLHDRRWAYSDAPRWIKGASARIKELFPT